MKRARDPYPLVARQDFLALYLLEHFDVLRPREIERLVNALAAVAHELLAYGLRLARRRARARVAAAWARAAGFDDALTKVRELNPARGRTVPRLGSLARAYETRPRVPTRVETSSPGAQVAA